MQIGPIVVGLARDMVVTISGVGIPVPAAVWIFGSALILLGWIRSRLMIHSYTENQPTRPMTQPQAGPGTQRLRVVKPSAQGRLPLLRTQREPI